MADIAGYHIDEHLSENESSIVYRARRQPDNLPVIIKMMQQAYPTPGRIARFKHEYEIAHSLDVAGVVRIYDLENDQHRWLLTMEDIGGTSLDRLGLAGALDVADFLRLAIQFTDILGHIHQRHIIHKDINPSNLVVNRSSGQVCIIDFSISVKVTPDMPSFRSSRMLEGTLAYMSPEQTGRMNRETDYRTDLYSLGATCYELLTGLLPFPTRDELELVHSHIARQPAPPHTHKPDLPRPLCDMIMRLLEKNPEDRYQSAYGLRADLEECLQQWQSTGQIVPFPLGQYDDVERFAILPKVYGRARELSTLLNAFSDSSRGTSQLLLVSGPVGVGKSALVQELYQHVLRRQGFFIAGTCDRVQHSIPYAALIQACRSLVRHLLTESEAQIAAWREALLAALGPNGQLIIDVIPDVQLIIGRQPNVPMTGTTRAQNRFQRVFRQFLSVFASPEHPLVLFLDDIHWLDTASLQLLERMLTAPGSRYLLIIGAFRDSEIDQAHPLYALRDTLQRAGGLVSELALAPLDVSSVTRLVAESLHCALAQARPLAKLVVTKTGGNPFFVQEFLQSLYHAGLLSFNYERRCWDWDIQQVQVREMTDNVITLMEQKVQRLSEETRTVLTMAACVGNQFDLVTLAVVSEKQSAALYRDLQQALSEGLIVPVRDTYTFMVLDEDGHAEEVPAEYTFAHTRLQQTLYTLIPVHEKPAVHWQIGQLLLGSMPPEEREERIFDIVYQLNQGFPALLDSIAVQDSADRDPLPSLPDVATFNLQAGRRAKEAAAYEAAFDYLQTGTLLLGDAIWQQDYHLSLDLYSEAIEVAYLSGRFAEVEQWAATVIEHAASLLDAVRVYEMLLLTHGAQYNPLEAVRIGCEVLEHLGLSFPPDPARADTLRALEESRALLAQQQTRHNGDLPLMSDPHHLAVMRILLRLSSVAREVLPEIFNLSVVWQVIYSLKHGNAPSSSVAYANYGMVLCQMQSDLEQGYQAGMHALHLSEQAEFREFRARTAVLVHAFIRPWKDPLATVLPPLQEAYQHCLDAGDIESAALAAQSSCALALLSGKDLTELERTMAVYNDMLSQFGQRTPLLLHRIYHQAVLNVLDSAGNPCDLSGTAYDEAHMLPQHQEAYDSAALYVLHINKLVLCYLFGFYVQAVEHAAAAARYEQSTGGSFLQPLQMFYDSLAHLALLADHPTDDAEERAALLERVAANQQQLECWAQQAPANYLHKWHLVQAERARVEGRAGDAWQAYHRASMLAEQQRFIHEEALAHELAARFYLAQELPQFAHVCLQDAYYAYLRWGSLTRARDLEARYPHILAQVVTPAREGNNGPPGQTVYRAASEFDFASVVRASQAISEDIVLEVLLTKLMKIVIENAGAERGVLLLRRHGQWFIEAEGHVSRPHVTVLQAIALESEHEMLLPLSVINYVAHTHESLVIKNAIQHEQFNHDVYVKHKHLRSILCAPLLNQGNLTGVLYLENNLAEGVFTPDRLEVLNLLSAQAAISIEKAKLYTNLEAALEQQLRLTKAYSRFVPREILQFLGKDSITQVELGDQIQQEMTVLFADIRNFTPLSEQMTPQETFNFLNSYLSRVSPIIRENNGFIDKYIGDAIMAIFPEQPEDALQAAICIQKEVMLYNSHRANQSYQPISIGIGLHIGSLMLGTVGESERMEGTVISDAVNLTARLEKLTRLYGASIVMSEGILHCLEAPETYQMRFLGKAKVKGKQHAVAVFEILDGNPPEIRQAKLRTRIDFELGLQHYSQQAFAQAIACFERVLQVHSGDTAAQLYLQRARHWQTYGVSIDWEATEVYTDK